MKHNTTVPEQLKDVKMPKNPLNEWSDSTLKRRFASEWEHRMGLDDFELGYSSRVYLHALRDELLERGISPVTTLEEYTLEDGPQIPFSNVEKASN